MSEHIFKSHNKSLLLYHLVCPAKYRKKVFSKSVESKLKEVCKEIEIVHEMFSIEIGNEIILTGFGLVNISSFKASMLYFIVKNRF